MGYFSGIRLGVCDRVPLCKVWIDRVFPFHALNYAHTGSIEWRTNDGKTISLEAPVLFWTWPRQRFTYGIHPPSGGSWDQSYVTYSGPAALRMTAAGLAAKSSTPWQRISDPQTMRRGFDELLTTLHQPAPDVDLAANLLQGLLLKTRANAQPQGLLQNSLAGQMTLLRNRIAIAPAKSWSSHQEADRLGISAVHFRRLFAAGDGTPFHRFVILARLQQAAGLLRQTQLPIKRIAMQCGYDDLSHFHKAFASKYTQPPAGYRRAAQLMGGSWQQNE